jgi:hypothetical protein
VARIEFWGGVGVIGSSRVLVHDGGHQVLLDLGLDIPAGSDLFRSPADLPLGPASAMLHANGEPLGPFDPRWPLYTGWLAQCGLPLRLTGCSGARLAG